MTASAHAIHPKHWQLRRRLLRTTELTGRRFSQAVMAMVNLLALIWAAVFVAATPASWTPFTRLVFARQILFTAIDGMFVAMRIAAAVGVLVIVQASLWLDAVGASTDDISPTLWKAIIREIAPLLASLVVIGRSGIAISTELATMLVSGEIEVLNHRASIR